MLRPQDFRKGMAVSDKSDLSFTEDGRIVMFGIKEIPEPEADEEDKDEEEEAKFDLWHWNDPYPQPQQMLMAQRERNNTWESVYYVDTRKFVKLADKEIPDVELAWNGKVAFAQSNGLTPNVFPTLGPTTMCMWSIRQAERKPWSKRNSTAGPPFLLRPSISPGSRGQTGLPITSRSKTTVNLTGFAGRPF